MQIGAKAIDQADALLPFLHFTPPVQSNACLILAPFPAINIHTYHVPELTAPCGFHRLDSTAQSVMAITISTDPLVEPTHPEARLDNPHHP
ncbi:hypothetical protein PGT21_021111 [Puccinia graminis f. sp. tritici]|uniref:Uncharacterized protein n=1 Tax=Puccinia graminis f. sp. tritici TaxID=56615 RepID=A0A5B0LU08_PUCGR|nr:hypothetical protein PGT21_021111 [Puccinia graminis f. sp. tritici]